MAAPKLFSMFKVKSAKDYIPFITSNHSNLLYCYNFCHMANLESIDNLIWEMIIYQKKKIWEMIDIGQARLGQREYNYIYKYVFFYFDVQYHIH